MIVLSQVIMKLETSFLLALSYTIMLANKFFIGLGMSFSVIKPAIVKEYIDNEEEGCFIYQLVILGIFNMVYINMFSEDGLHVINFGIGLTPMTPIITIGWRNNG